MRAPLASCTLPRRDPRGFWSCSAAAISAIRIKVSARCGRISFIGRTKIRLNRGARYYQKSFASGALRDPSPRRARSRAKDVDRRCASIGPALRLAIPAMVLQFGQESGVQRAGIAGGDVLAHMLRTAHAYDGGADGGMGKDEAKGHFWKRHACGQDFLQLVHTLYCVGKI